MLVHTVFFWLDPKLKPEQVAEFEERLNRLPTISAVKYGFTGRPSSTSRPIIDRTYSYGLTLVFENLAKHDEYQVDPLHQEFVEKCSSMWLKVTIYDFE
ncbi:MAG TPA: Dabb family protein [Blastocatellia bacterium]|nr:Dabb family protein [Blastocatellia bacterium]